MRTSAPTARARLPGSKRQPGNNPPRPPQAAERAYGPLRQRPLRENREPEGIAVPLPPLCKRGTPPRPLRRLGGLLLSQRRAVMVTIPQALRASHGAPERTQRSGSFGERRRKGAGGVSGGLQPGTEQSGLCADDAQGSFGIWQSPAAASAPGPMRTSAPTVRTSGPAIGARPSGGRPGQRFCQPPLCKGGTTACPSLAGGIVTGAKAGSHGDNPSVSAARCQLPLHRGA